MSAAVGALLGIAFLAMLALVAVQGFLGRRQRKAENLWLRHAYPYDYLGPSTRWGLEHGTWCRMISARHYRARGGRRIETPDGRTWLVSQSQLRLAVPKGPDAA